MMNWKDREGSVRSLYLVEGTDGTTLSPSRDSSRGFPEYETGVLPARLPISVPCFIAS
jgi:hypothetical protein